MYHWCGVCTKVQPGPHQIVGTVDGTDVFSLFCHPQLEPDPYFTARYAGAVGIK